MKRFALIGSAGALFLCALVTILMLGASTARVKQALPVTISNETEALQVVSSRIEKNMLVLQIRNVGDQSVIAYNFDIKAKAKEGFTVDLSDGTLFRSQSDLTATVPLNGLPETADGSRRFNISMALFEDGSAQGDWERSRIQREKFEGMALALAHVRHRMANIRQASVLELEQFANNINIKNVNPPITLTGWQKIGYQQVITNAQIQAELAHRLPSLNQSNLVEFKNFLDRKISNIRKITEGRQR